MLLRGLFNQARNIKFFKFSTIISYFSLIAMGISMVLFLTLGLNYGIDFRGGTLFMISTPNSTDISNIRSSISGVSLGDVSITKTTDPLENLTGGAVAREKNIFLIKVERADDINIETVVKKTLSENIVNITFLQIDTVGSKISGELVKKGALAVILAVFFVLIYIWLRFEWQFALGAVIALVHDVVLTIGIFSIFRFEFNLSIIAALLTIIGYSLNDTVVVFDRVRENLRSYKSKALIEILDLSINNTLSRTIMTSLTTLLALLALFFVGGDVIRGFTFAMIWGVIVGTYSSIFVAAKVLLILDVKRNWYKDDSKAGTQF
jgi:preprotein translocase subunit SecF